MTGKPIPTKRQARFLRSLKRPPGYFIDRSNGRNSNLMVDAGWLKATPLNDAPGSSSYRATDAGREALAEFQRVLRHPTPARDPEELP